MTKTSFSISNGSDGWFSNQDLVFEMQLFLNGLG